MARKKEDFASIAADGFVFDETLPIQEESIPVEAEPTAVDKPKKQIAEKKKGPGRPVGSITKKPEEKRQHFSVTLEPEMIIAIREQAKKEDRSITKIVERAVTEYLKNN